MKINDMYIDEGPHDPHIFKAIFMVGGPGAGKSTIANQIAAGTGLRQANVDIVYELLMNKQDTEMSQFDPETHQRAIGIHGRRRENFISGRLGLILDGTGRHYDVIADLKSELEAIGYQTSMVYVNTDVETALNRMEKRNRRVDTHFLQRTHKILMKNLGKFQSLFGNNLFIVDNTDDFDDVDRKSLEKNIAGFLQTPISSVAKDWISGK